MNCLLNVFVRAREEEKFLNTIEENRKLETPFDIVSYGTMIKFYQKSSNFSKALEIVKEMEEKNFERDRLIYNMLISSCKMPELKETALGIFEEMKEKSIPRENITYDTILHKLFVCKDYKMVYEYYNRMLEAKVKPTKFTYFILLSACRDDDLNIIRARLILKDMKLRNFKPNEEIRSILNKIISERKYNRKINKELIIRKLKISKN
jgi:pentatricopeptide repeat protein